MFLTIALKIDIGYNMKKFSMITKLGKDKPSIDKTAYVCKSAEVIGKVKIGKYSSVWPNAVIRGDVEEIVIGEYTSIQDCVVIHTNYGIPTNVGNYVIVGHSAVIHGCTIGNNCLIGIGSIILDGAKIGNNCLIGAGAVVTENKVIPEGSLVVGIPGKIVRLLSQAEINKITAGAKEYLDLMDKSRKQKL